MPWYGEFSGKYLTAAALVYRMQDDEALKAAGDYVVGQLAATQDTDGYLGVWPDAEKLNGQTADKQKTWDVWSHYHNMLGLYYWNLYAGSNELAKDVLLRAADCIYTISILCTDHDLDEGKDGTDAAIGHVFSLIISKQKRQTVFRNNSKNI